MPVTFYPAGPLDIRAGTVSRIKAAQQALGLLNVFTARTQPTQDSQLPYAIVWNAGERTEPNGDPNVGAPAFFHRLMLMVDVSTSATADASLDSEVVNLVESIRSLLMTDPTWVMLFEGLERCDTRYAYPQDATSKMAQGMIEFELTYRSDWEPNLPNLLQQIDLQTTAPHAGVEVLINLPQDATSPPQASAPAPAAAASAPSPAV